MVSELDTTGLLGYIYITKIKQLSMLEDPLMVFQISIVHTLSITQLETTHKGGFNQMISH